MSPLPYYISDDCDELCRMCEAPVKSRADTQTWYITISHPGFNLPANNAGGYATQAAAIAAYNRCRGAR